MFDFQKLTIYQKAKDYNKEITTLIKSSKFDRVTNDQLRRASFSILLNIAESSSRFSNKDRRRFLEISRGSAFECVAILEYLNEVSEIEDSLYESFFSKLEEISKMLFGLMRKLN
jgi:four helix bundle protein